MLFSIVIKHIYLFCICIVVHVYFYRPQTCHSIYPKLSNHFTHSEWFFFLFLAGKCEDLIDCSGYYRPQACHGIYQSWSRRYCPVHCGFCPSKWFWKQQQKSRKSVSLREHMDGLAVCMPLWFKFTVSRCVLPCWLFSCLVLWSPRLLAWEERAGLYASRAFICLSYFFVFFSSFFLAAADSDCGTP